MTVSSSSSRILSPSVLLKNQRICFLRGDTSRRFLIVCLLLPELKFLFHEPFRRLRRKKRSERPDSPSAGAEEDDNKEAEEVEQRESRQEASRGVAEAEEEMETEDTEVPGSQAPPPPQSG